MRKHRMLPLLGALLVAPILYFSFELDTEAQTCCTPPPRPTAVPRYPQNTNVTVYIDITGLNTPSGFSDLEKQAITDGIENWNGQANNSGVTFTVQETTNPPTVPAQANIAVVQYQNQQNPGAIADTQTFSSGPYVSNRITFYQNIRNVFDIPQNQPRFVRTVARHEAGHTLGLGNADDCDPGTTIMNPASSGETFITNCDNNAVANQNSVYPSPTPTPEETCDGSYEGPVYWGGGDIDCSLCNDSIDNDCNGPWDDGDGGCIPCLYYSPILVDVDGSGFRLTNPGSGVWFDFFGTGNPVRLSWTSEYSTNAWLALDRNNNGRIDSARELFGNLTPQPALIERNGFIALAEYDKPELGGNSDGLITNADNIFSSLRLWQDTNHNGISEPHELHALPELGIATLECSYKESRRIDEYGNEFRYRGKVKDTHGSQSGRWAWDVFLKSAP